MKTIDVYKKKFTTALPNTQLHKDENRALYLGDNRRNLSPFQLRFNNLPVADAIAKKALLLLKKPVTNNNQDT